MVRVRAMYASDQISAADYIACTEKELTKCYLSRDNPRAQSGHGGDIYRWRNLRWMILEPVYHDGTFIDVGCANGHLIESLDRWMRSTDVKVEFYGLEVSEGLLDLAQRRLPDFASRLFLGNALDWQPPFKFDYVYSMILPDIPQDLWKQLLDNLHDNYLKPGGRLILGPWKDKDTDEELLNIGYTAFCSE